jgi:chemotaxis signal transduction protein
MQFLQIEVNKQNYLINTDCVSELLHYQEPMPTAYHSEYIDGIISHKDKVVPILSIRKLLGFSSFKDEQIEFIKKVEGQHIAWVKEFESCLESGEHFTKALNPHKCELGMWIDKTLACLRCNNYGFVELLTSNVIEYHDALHNKGNEFLSYKDGDKEEQVQEIHKNANSTINGLHILESSIDKLTSAFEQIVLVNINGKDIGVVVDRIDKTHDLEDKEFFTSTKNMSHASKYLQFVNYYDIEGTLMFSMKFTPAFDALFSKEEEKLQNHQ